LELTQFRDEFFAGTPRYRWLETIGRGGLSVVFKAHDRDLTADIAIKVLAPSFDYDEAELLQRFKQEISLNRRVKHPNVTRLFDYGKSGYFPYITMEFVPGRNLETVVDSEGALRPSIAVPILRQVAMGVAAAHRAGIVHRDLKSANVMVNDAGEVAVLDFGLAFKPISDRLTVKATIFGTPQYMAPEQAMGRSVDERSDIYSIGVIAFELLLGRLPYQGTGPLDVAMKHATDPIPEMTGGRYPVSEDLALIVRRCLLKLPLDRYQTARELEQDLANIPLGDVLPLPVDAGERFAADGVPDERPTSPLPVFRPQKDPIERRSGGRRRVFDRPPVALVVDDDSNMSTILDILLRSEGFDTRVADSGLGALLELESGRPVDVLLLDVWMPRMDGFATLRALRVKHPALDLPVVLMSASIDRSQIAFATQLGASVVLEKPLDPDVVIAKIREIFDTRGLVFAQ